MTRKTREEVFEKYTGHCAYCGTRMEIRDMQVDHVVPRDKGGSDDLGNLNPSCRACNFYKTNFDLETFRKRLIEFQDRFLASPPFIVKLAELYGIATRLPERPWDGKFYFEKQDNNPQ